MCDQSNDSGLGLKYKVWEKAVDTQMHFNEMSVKSRQLGLTFVVAALGVAIVLLSKSSDEVVLEILFIKVHVSVLVLLVTVVALHAVRKLDLGVYHMMLRGAVSFGQQLEEECIRDKIMGTPNGMTEMISLYSRYEKIKLDGKKLVGDGAESSALVKLNSFYNYAQGFLFLLALIVLILPLKS